MRLTWRDGLGTLLTAGAVGVALAVSNGWGWPLLGDARAGVIGITILSFFSCPLAARIGAETRWLDPLLLLTGILGVAAFVLVVLGLFANSLTVLADLTAVVIVMWLLTTVRHLFEAAPAARRPAAL